MLASSVGSDAGPPSQSLLRALGLDALAEREPEAVAAPRALLHVRLRLGLLLAREGLGVREADAPAAFLDREHEHLDLGVRGEGLAGIGAAAQRELSRRHEPCLPGPEPHEDAERLVALDRPGEHRAHLDERLHLLTELGALGRQGQRDAALLSIDADDQNRDLRAVGRGLPQRPLTASRNLCDVQEAVDTRQELDEDAEVGRADRAPAHDLPLAQSSRYCGPRIALEGLQAERDPALLLVDPEHLDGHGVTDAQEVGRTTHARMGQLRQRHEPLHAAQVDERAEVRERRDGAGQHRARQDLLPRLLGRLSGVLLQQAPAREHQIAPVLAEGRDAELEHPADVLLRGLHAAQVHLRERTEAPQAADRDLVATLDHGRHLALDRDAGLRRHGQRLPGLGALAQLVREPDLIAGRHHGRFDLVADGHAELALAVGQLGALDPGFALAPDVDEHAFGRAHSPWRSAEPSTIAPSASSQPRPTWRWRPWRRRSGPPSGSRRRPPEPTRWCSTSTAEATRSARPARTVISPPPSRERPTPACCSSTTAWRRSIPSRPRWTTPSRPTSGCWRAASRPAGSSSAATPRAAVSPSRRSSRSATGGSRGRAAASASRPGSISRVAAPATPPRPAPTRSSRATASRRWRRRMSGRATARPRASLRSTPI